MRILVLGGTVFLGRHLVEAALARGHRVTLFHRGRHGVDLFPEAERILGDRRHDLAPLHGRAWDVVIDTSGYKPSELRASTSALSGRVARYVFVSSVSVYRDFSEPGMDESAPVGRLTPEELGEAEGLDRENDAERPRFVRYYGPLKALCEEAVCDAFQAGALIVRPALIVGPYDTSDRFTYWPARIARGGDVVAPGPPERPIQMIDVRDLATWIIVMAEAGTTGTFNVTGPAHPLSMGEIFAACRLAAASDARPVWVDDGWLTDAGVTPWSELPLWIPLSLDPQERGSMAVDGTRAIAAGLTFRPIEETVRDTLAWDRKRSADLPRRAGLAPEREAELLRKALRNA